ncbi:TetR/AcrR family transcriptional regulator [Nonomuraea typhae]|uniref:TetR/AcrR family transcriptional regulator n=1 Tax=Nonomuraea typhae TaxID=2603600 RepID=A0ABW7Z5A6_9ACTN
MAEERRQWRVLGRPRGRPPRITRPAIADAALEVGFDNLTLATVGERLQVSHSALYRHVADRQELVILAIDRAMQRAEWPDPTGEWRADLREQAWAIWRLLDAHPGLIQEFLRLTRFPSQIMVRFGAAVRHLMACGFTPRNAFLAVDTVFDLTVDVFGRGQQMDRPSGAGPVRVTTADAWAEGVGAEVAELMRAALEEPAATWFERKLTLVLDGVAASLAP